MARIFLEIVGGIFIVCSVIEWLTNYEFNPCQVARQYLGSNARTGRLCSRRKLYSWSSSWM